MTSVTVSSPLLSDPPPVPPKPVRPVDPDFAATEDAGYIESLEAFGARIDLRHAAGLAIGGALFLIAGYYIQTWGTHA
ncbi:hypothetical protein ADK55_18465 [Streptomyces sp. WM4235]|uniref:hypothetical protein n=1 Tax=Streptomyces sp. WM4235 TaxID=1415551 RepID=UPI0006AF9D3E|nr:hypothetical protein [Streptomyces sp. WM4235]KOU50533.1 hypothetical protein ADK55_18465 [Streptomyces sp. WM4235]